MIPYKSVTNQAAPEVLRTFIAVKINPGEKLLSLFEGIQKELSGELIKWAEPGQLHLTLKFLGDTTLRQAKEIETILEEMATQISPFRFRISGLGFFKNQGQPKVLFAGITEWEKIKQLASEIDRQVAFLGFAGELREFRPHLTLGRIKYIKNKSRFYALVEKLKETEFQNVEVDEIVFFQSVLKPHGPVYKSLKTVVLKQ